MNDGPDTCSDQRGKASQSILSLLESLPYLKSHGTPTCSKKSADLLPECDIRRDKSAPAAIHCTIVFYWPVIHMRRLRQPMTNGINADTGVVVTLRITFQGVLSHEVQCVYGHCFDAQAPSLGTDITGRP
jgi:hypothetical protein